MEEKEVDWSKVAVDTPILVRDFVDQNWARRHFAKYENGYVFAWDSGRTSWYYGDNTFNGTSWEYAKLPDGSESD